MAPDPRLKQIRIGTGVLKRIAKERLMYEKELETEHKRLQKLKDEGRDEHEIQQQNRVVEESASMVPESRKRLQSAYESLNQLIQEVGDAFLDDEDFKASLAALQSVHVEDRG